MASWFQKSAVEVYNGIQLKKLPLNYAYVLLNSTLDRFGVYSVDDNCYKCLPRIITFENAFYSDNNAYFEVNTGKQYTWKIIKQTRDEYVQPGYENGLLCEMRPSLGEYGVYKLNVDQCTLETVVVPVNPYLPLLLFSFIILSCFIVIYWLVKLFLSRSNNEAEYNEDLNLTAGPDNLDVMPSLHCLRGILLILIIFVTTGGGGYPIFSTNFGGLTVAEGLFLAFSLSIGLKVPITLDEEANRLPSERSMFCMIVAKSVLLFILGLAIDQLVPWTQFHTELIFAPLCRVSVVYFVSAIVYMFISKDPPSQSKDIFVKAYSNIQTLMWGWILTGFLLIIMIVSTRVLYATDCKPSLDSISYRIGWRSDGNYCEENRFNEVLKKIFLAVNRDKPFYIESYYAFNSGLLGVLSPMLASLIGLKAGVVYIQNENHSDRIKLWLLHAWLLCLAGVIFAGRSDALNFNLWPIATIFLISSLTLCIYSFIYYLTEVLEITSSIITTFGSASMMTLTGHLLSSQSVPFFWRQNLDSHFFYLWQCTWIVALWIFLTICLTKCRFTFISRAVKGEYTKCDVDVLSW